VLILGAIKTKKSQCAESQRNKGEKQTNKVGTGILSGGFCPGGILSVSQL